MASAPTPRPPEARELAALGSDAWAEVLGGVRRVLRAPPHLADSGLAPFRDAPTSRLVGGRTRRALAERLAEDAVLWDDVLDRISPPTSDELVALLARSARPAGEAADHETSVRGWEPAGLVPGQHDERGTDAPRTDRGKERARELRRERDAWRRRAEGAEIRIGQVERQVADLKTELSDVRDQLASARVEVEESQAERQRAVGRERRRREAELSALEEQVATLRREREQRRTDVRRRTEARRLAELDAARTASEAQRRAADEAPLRVVAGRPSRLPRGVEPGTTEAARALLHRGRLVLVDGYNVSKQHRGQLDLETQRSWLINQLGVLVRRRGVRAIVVFDGQARGGGRPPSALREVEVRFTEAGITADDDLVFAVEATDEPVVVVTDDRELIGRVAASGADVVGTRAFLGVLS